MPAKKKAVAETKAEAPKAQTQDQAMKIFRKEREAEAALLQAKADAAVVRQRSVKPDPQGDIDQRMAALLKDHQEMGVRPK